MVLGMGENIQYLHTVNKQIYKVSVVLKFLGGGEDSEKMSKKDSLGR